MIGLTGAHRVGKSTLAEAYAKKHSVKFIRTRAAEIFKELGHDPAEKLDFSTRLAVQEKILYALDQQWRSAPIDAVAITDRTPLDFLAYTLSEANGDLVDGSNTIRLKRYIDDCFDCLNKHFSTIVVVQPGIRMVAESGKAVTNEAYVEHLNSLILGLTVGERLKTPHYYIPKRVLDVEGRVKCIENAVGKTEAQALEMLATAAVRGILIH